MSYADSLREQQRDIPKKLDVIAEAVQGLGAARILKSAAREIEWWRANNPDKEYGGF